MTSPQALQYLHDRPAQMLEASISTFATTMVAELVRESKLDAMRSEAYADWLTHMLLADFNAEYANQIAEENRFDKNLLAQTLDAILEKRTKNGHV